MENIFQSLPRVRRSLPRLVGMFALGLLVGGFFHYLLFRLGLPVQPFIYAAF
jgi:hypothetical protein